jgi:Bifunctional DNA primase/polymerase, N-terminal
MKKNFNYLHEINGLQFIPVNDKKCPTIKNWQKSKAKHILDSYSVGLVCGEISGNLEVIDFDLKNLNDVNFPLMTKFKEKIKELDSELMNLMTIQKTKSGGFHFLYRCSKICGNIKLANVFPNKVIIETRGEGGQIVVAPSDGYKFIFGDLKTIKTITEEQREILLSTAMSFNEVIEEKQITAVERAELKKEDSPFIDYNNRADIISLLEKHGWSNATKKGSKTHLKRPGNTTAEFSGNYDEEKKWFSVFTTSTEFDPNKAYQPYAVYTILECNGDYSLAAKQLLKQGYGNYNKPTIPKDNNQDYKKSPSKINLDDEDYSFIGNINEAKDDVFKRMRGEIILGKSSGYPNTLDKYYLLKESELGIVHGIDNVGKSVWIWHNALVSALLHGWKWVIYSAENSHASFLSKMCEFYWCQQVNTLSTEMVNEAVEFIEKHFIWIISDEELYSYVDIIMIAKKISKKMKYQGFLVDPYNSLKILESSKLSEHSYHLQAISEFKLFTKNYKTCLYINAHTNTGAQRMPYGEKEIPAPMKADIDGGVKFGAKADVFITIHRHVGSEEKYNQTEVHVRKIKEQETGGRPTPFQNPVILTASHGVTMFKDENGHSPIASIRGKIHKVDTYNPSRTLTPIRDITESKRTAIYGPNTKETTFINSNNTPDEEIPF